MTDTSTVVSAVASVVSAVGGAFATIAAFRSATSAREAQLAAQISEKRAALRQLTVTANEVVVEVARSESRGAELKLSYSSLFALSGSKGGSREALYITEIDKKLGEASNLSVLASPFASGQDELMNGPIDEIGKRETKIAQALVQARAIREDFERQHLSVESQCAMYRVKTISGPNR